MVFSRKLPAEEEFSGTKLRFNFYENAITRRKTIRMQRTVDALVKYPEDKSMEKAINGRFKDKSIVEDSEDKLIVEDSEDMKIVEDSEDKEVVEDAMEFEVESTMDHEAFANE
ncbi:hypothetical protein G2W53_044614 [Senna tora]|uniref:Uncharacterized protein n=1 Tax=Senna tora TaxID=362788 RepID=A0A834SDI3_9FABA|nr:hypothetical protein G2W53_044614 [Senna tora]